MKTIKEIKKVAIVGVGMMAGSIALELKALFPRVEIWGFARNQASYLKLKKLHIVDVVEKDLEKVVKNADLVIMGLPVYLIIEYCRAMGPFLKSDAVVFDLGSTKELIEKSVRKFLPSGVGFVGCHPLCGSEKSGARFARRNLYKNSLCIITSPAKNSATRFVKDIWKALGARVVFLSATRHDTILARVSHLPHIISFSITHCVPHAYLKFGPPSLKDLTRISDSPANVWTDIFLSNKKNITRDIRSFIKVLQQFQKATDAGDSLQLARLITKANIKHRYFL
ncbi:MAG: prephenate dehydrogenase [Candidatus Omnitrophica bacterium]|nr:prephenate dehydrogenase [Candidatus Omnitrophota bacterium]